MKKFLCLLVIINLLAIIPSQGIATNESNPLQTTDIIIVDQSGSADFTTIQEAIQSANNGDHIFVRNGIYKENIIIDKSLILEGEHKEQTIIDGKSNDDVISVTAEHVTISNIQIRNSGKSGRDSGIEVSENYITIHDTIIRDTTIGIHLIHSNYHQITNNILTENKDYGLHLYYSSANTIHSNIISYNRWGILFVYANENTITDNQVTYNKNYGLWFLRRSIENTVINNNINFNEDKGILIQLFCYNNIFDQNEISNNKEGISLGLFWSCDNIIIQNNKITENTDYGIYISDSYYTQILENNFENNGIHAFFHTCEETTWNNNYWQSQNNKPYIIRGKRNNIPWINIDWNPSVNPYNLQIQSGSPRNQKITKNNEIISNTNNYPESFTWRNVDGIDYTSPVKNQIPTPTCEAYALCSALETMIHYQSRENFGCDLSEAHLFFYPGGTADWGVDVVEPAEYLITYGVPDEGCFPDPHRPYDFSFSSIQGWEERTIKIQEWGWVDNDINSIKNALITYGPLVICQMTRKDLDLYNNGVYMPKISSPLQRGHVTTIFGYDDNEQCWIIRNSAGESWGEEGYFRISYEGFEQIYAFIYPFYGGTGILYVDGVYGNFQPDVPKVEITKPSFYKTYIFNNGYDSIIRNIPSIQRSVPRIIGDLTVTVDAEQTEKIEFYIDSMHTHTDESVPFTWNLETSKGLHTLEIIAYKNDIISKDIIDIYIV